MRAVVLERHGGPESFRIASLPDPEPAPHEVRVRVLGSSLNPADARARRPEPGPRAIPRTFPLVLGYDFSGVVDACGEAVEGLRLGDAVFGCPSLVGQGAHAAYVRVDARTLAPKPVRLSHAEAGVAPLVCLTAYGALFERARVQPGQWVLVHGGAGGVGHVAIQMAKHAGCRVLASAGRPASLAFCEALGADAVLDYTRDDLVARVLEVTEGRGVDAVLATVGGEALAASARCAAPFAQLVALVPTDFAGAAQVAFMRALTIHYELMGARVVHGVEPARMGRALAQIARWLDEGWLRVSVHASFPPERMAEAHRLLERGGFEGKLAIDLTTLADADR